MWKLFGLYFLIFAVTVAANNCNINLKDVNDETPVILKRTSTESHYELFKPTGEKNELTEGTHLLLSCPGTKFSKTQSTNIELKCQDGKLFDSSYLKKSYELKSLVCEKIPVSTLQFRSARCFNNIGYIYEAGFEVKGEFYGPVFKICKNGMDTYYTHNTINGKAIKYALTRVPVKHFKSDTMGVQTVVLDNMYTQANQETHFEKYFGKGQTIIKAPKYLARGHLAPDADFIFAYEKKSTYCYANVAPEFQNINGGNWLKVERLGRSIAEIYQDNIESYNGNKDVLQMQNTSGDMIDIALDDTNQIKVPKYYYKVLVHTKSDSAIAYITVNNPYINITDAPAHEFCKNVCKDTKFNHANFPILSDGYTFCCELSDFKTAVHSFPAEIQASNLLGKIKV